MNKSEVSFDQSIETYSASAKSTKKMGKGKLLAFGAAAAGGLLASSQAEADVVYSGPLNMNVPGGSFAYIDMDANGANDFFMSHYAYSTGAGFLFGSTGSGLGIQTAGTTSGGYFHPLQGVASSGSFSVGQGQSVSGWLGWAHTSGLLHTNRSLGSFRQSLCYPSWDFWR